MNLISTKQNCALRVCVLASVCVRLCVCACNPSLRQN